MKSPNRLQNSRCSNLFVYGTLRRAFQNDFTQLLAEKASFLGNAQIQGRLYRFEHYPGVKLSGDADDWVVGEVYRLDRHTERGQHGERRC